MQKVWPFPSRFIFLGPINFLLTAVAALLLAGPIDLFFLMVASLLLFALYPKKALTVSVACLFFSVGFHHVFLGTSHLTLLGIEISYVLGLFITHISLQQIGEDKKKDEDEKENFLQKLSLEKEQSKHIVEISLNKVTDLEKQVDFLKNEIVKKEKNLLDTLELLDVVKKSDLETENWKKEFNQKMVEKDQKIENLQKSLDEKDLVEKASLQERTEKNWEMLYQQLRGQFEEKKEELHATRKQLFLLKEELLAFEKQKELENPDEKLFQSLLALEEKVERSNQEISMLESILTAFFNEKPKRKRKTPAVTI